jgi:hypothetical protein
MISAVGLWVEGRPRQVVLMVEGRFVEEDEEDTGDMRTIYIFATDVVGLSLVSLVLAKLWWK